MITRSLYGGFALAGFVSAVALSPGREQVIGGAYDDAVIAWDINSGRQLYRIKGHDKSDASGVLRAVTNMLVSRDGKFMTSVRESNFSVEVWSLKHRRVKFLGIQLYSTLATHNSSSPHPATPVCASRMRRTARSSAL